MRCVAIDGSGAIIDVSPQPVDASACVLVLASPTELQSPWTDLFSLTDEDAVAIALAVIGCWVVGWVVGLASGVGSQRHD